MNENEVSPETYKVAAALGHPLPAPHRSAVTVVSVISLSYKGELYELTSFVSRTPEEAVASLAAWVVSVWEEGSAPWASDNPHCSDEEWDRLRDEYLAERSPQDIVDEYFDSQGYKKETGNGTVVRCFFRQRLVEETAPW